MPVSWGLMKAVLKRLPPGRDRSPLKRCGPYRRASSRTTAPLLSIPLAGWCWTFLSPGRSKARCGTWPAGPCSRWAALRCMPRCGRWGYHGAGRCWDRSACFSLRHFLPTDILTTRISRCFRFRCAACGRRWRWRAGRALHAAYALPCAARWRPTRRWRGLRCGGCARCMCSSAC